jgi:hypothetical protein
LVAAVETMYDISNTNSSLVLGLNGKIYLHQNDHFASVIINGTALANGTYPFAQLNSSYPANFPASWAQQAGSAFTTGSGQIIVGNVVVPLPLTITAGNQSKTYGQTLVLGTTNFNAVGLTNGNNVTSVTLNSAGTVNTAGVGSYAITPSAAVGSGLANYNITYSTNGLLTVNPAVLTITANNANRTYAAANPTFTYTPSGFVLSDGLGVLSGAPSLTTVANANSPVGAYLIVATNGNLNAANYAFSFVNGMLTISPAISVVNWANPAGIVYGTPLGADQNNAAAVPSDGNFNYQPTSGTVLPAGTNILTVVFTPNNTNYTTVTNSVQLVVTQAPSVPQITSIGLNGTGLSLTVTNGTPGGPWALLQSTDMALPLSQWQTNLTGDFDASGNLSTNLPNTATNLQEFYILEVQ